MFQPDRQLTVTLTAQSWSVVLQALGHGPWTSVNPLIQQIVEQTRAQTQAHELMPNEDNNDAA